MNWATLGCKRTLIGHKQPAEDGLDQLGFIAKVGRFQDGTVNSRFFV